MLKKYLTTSILIALLTSFVTFTYADWAAPTAPAPSGNAPAPLNVSNLAQNKQGILTLGGLGVFGATLMTSTTGYKLPTNLLLGVNGYIGAKGYCDENGYNCVSALGSGSSTGAGATTSGGDTIVCGGWDVKYGTTAPINAWGCGSSATCPSGYDTIKSSKVTINLAEQTNLCVLHSAGGGGSNSSQIIPGWPNHMICNRQGSMWGSVHLQAVDGTNVYYTDYQDRGYITAFNINTKKNTSTQRGDLAPYATPCVGKDLTDPIWTWY